MSFAVHITVSGLCMFVPAANDERRPMHVFMPKTGRRAGLTAEAAGATLPRLGGAVEGGDRATRGSDEQAATGGEAHEQHYVVMAWDTAYENEGQGQLDGCIRSVPLDHCWISIAEGADALFNPMLRESEVVLLDDSVYFDRVSHDCIEKSEERVTSRLELHAGAATGYCGDGAMYCLDEPAVCEDQHKPKKRHQRMAEHVEWTIGFYDHRVDTQQLVRVKRLDGAAVMPFPLPHYLYPVNGAIELRLLHVVEIALPQNGEFPNPPGNGPDHFTSYYELAHTPRPAGRPRLKPIVKKVSLRYPSVTCMTSQGQFTQ
jgi:hypothetical protein